MTEPTITEHLVRRVQVPLPGPYGDVRERYEHLVPVVDAAAFAAANDWAATLEVAKSLAPHGFMRYFSTDVTAAMTGSTTVRPTALYLMGNHTIAERMYRHDPAVMLHAPLRVVICQSVAGGTTMVLDRPSQLFASYGNPAIAEVGVHLDGLVAALVSALGGDPSALRS
ncbi:protein of uncharacterised function DUF302 [Mycolicibacterium fortuitum]|uniref:Protein of uncharacterized function DUF302 n=1 Tax=Mycolicibacterium fortuitum TaxID=1766 RepID=A0A378V2N3_MYCFO|nr:protein of uncharacterised function DUF302 [Mycolicibacterium fortuitum]